MYGNSHVYQRLTIKQAGSNMNILFFRVNEFIKDELQEYITGMKGKTFFANTIEEVVGILESYPIDSLFLDVRNVTDLKVLRYINEHFSQVGVILTVEAGFDEMLSTIKNGRFDTLEKPFTLKNLKHLVTRQYQEKTSSDVRERKERQG